MNELIIKGTTDTPEVHFSATGKLTLEGRAYNEDPRKFFEPLIQWCKQASIEKVEFEVKIDYMNTSSSKMLVELFKTIDANTHISEKEIKWYFDEDDEDILETGQIIEESTLSTRFYFLEAA